MIGEVAVPRRRFVGMAAALAWLPRARADQPGLPAIDRTEGDPLGTLQWPDLRREFIGEGAVAFSDRVRVRVPETADDPLNVPVMVDARGLAADGVRIRLIRVVVDRNPIRHVVDFEPLRSLPVLSLRLKLEQASPVRALAQAEDGAWHVAGAWVQAAGGGCTVAGSSRTDGSWSRTLNQVRARLFDNVIEGSRRLRVQVMHPMDTGLVAGIPAFHVERLALLDAAGQPWWRLALREPVSENPSLGFELPLSLSGPLRLRGQDNNGNPIDAVLTA